VFNRVPRLDSPPKPPLVLARIFSRWDLMFRKHFASLVAEEIFTPRLPAAVA
jgi:hypothetical protein